MRPEIQALRALAVGSVVLYHLWPNRVPGGYVGVDVFFVISGFLITGQLAAEVERTGRLRLGRFWARRAKRLVPASSIVLVSTTAAVLAFTPLYLWRQFLDEVIASALQLENWRLAHDAVDYLASDNERSPVQHFWSLAVEEQCYLVVPLLVLLPRRPLVLAVVTVLSFAWCVHQTATSPGVAYFSTLTRAWEFGCGGLLAMAGRRRLRVTPWLGIGVIIVTCVELSDRSAFPGWLALVPVGGTVVAIASGEGTTLARLGRWAPVALAGRVSYAAYLWHLPLLVLLPYATEHPLTRGDKIGVLLATALLSVASTVLVEEPVRFRRALLGDRRPWVVGAWCLAGVLTVLAVAGWGVLDDAQRTQQLATETRDVLTQDAGCLGARAMAAPPCRSSGRAEAMTPDPANARDDDDNRPECWGSTDGKPDGCHLGTTTGYTRKLLAIGDSHNNQLIGAYRTIGLHRGWRIDVAGMGSCYLTDAEQTAPSSGLVADCRSWQRQVEALARTGGYDGVIVTHSTHNRPVVVPHGSTRLRTTAAGLVSAWRKLPDVPLVAIRDNPRPRGDVLTCVSQHRSDAATRCAVSRTRAFADPDGQALAARQVPRAHVVDMSAYYCTSTSCPPVIGHVLVYRDGSHITATWASTLEPYLERAIARALGL